MPWYGALAHAIFFRKGTLDYFHTHVCAPDVTACTSCRRRARSVSGSSTTPGKLHRRRARTRGGNLAALPAVPRDHGNDRHRAVHPGGQAVRAAVALPILLALAALVVPAARSCGRRSGERLAPLEVRRSCRRTTTFRPAYADPARRAPCADAKARGYEIRVALIGWPEVRPRLRLRALAAADAVFALPRQGALLPLQGAAARRHSERARREPRRQARRRRPGNRRRHRPPRDRAARRSRRPPLAPSSSSQRATASSSRRRRSGAARDRHGIATASQSRP